MDTATESLYAWTRLQVQQTTTMHSKYHNEPHVGDSYTQQLWLSHE